MSSITVWGRRSAFNVQKVLWTLDELGLQYEHRNAGGSFGGLNAPQFLAMNPHGRVPVLVDGELTVWESHSIMRYLAATYGSGSLWPPTPAARSFADRWMDWSATTLQPDFMKLFWGYYRMPENQRDLHAINAAVEACNRHFGVLDTQLKNQRFLGGTEFTMADIPAGTTLYRYFEMGVEVARPPHVCQWYDRLALRPAFRQHIMVRFDELRGRTDY
jgi:glutathione S-transferase